VNSSFDASAIVRGSLLLLGLIVALFFGILIGEANWTALTAIGAFLVIATIAQFTVRHLIAICLVLVTLDLWMAPVGFKISPLEQIGIVTMFCWLMVWWRRNFNPVAPTAFMELGSWRFFQLIVNIGAAYAVAHFIYNMVNPYDELAFGWKGATKTYLQTFGAFFLLVFIVRTRLLFSIDAKHSLVLLRIFLVAVTTSVSIGIGRAIVLGPEIETGLSLEEKSEIWKLFTVPGLNAYDNVYTLRQLGPAAVLVGSMFFFSRPRNLGPLLPATIMFLGFLGSLLSAGRASLVIAVAFLLASMLRSRTKAAVFAVVGFIVILIASVLILPTSLLKEAPWTFQRSIGWLRPDLQTQATLGIEGSSNMRWDYFKFSWNYYTSGDLRLLLFGRSAGQMDSIDVTSFMLYNEPAKMEFAVRRLVTHNGMTDFLIGWGFIGYILNVTMCVACIAMLYQYLSMFSRSSYSECWIFSALMFLLYWLVYTHIGGAFVWPLALGFVIVALAQTDGLNTTDVYKKSI
jgi:hypothetical protein